MAIGMPLAIASIAFNGLPAPGLRFASWSTNPACSSPSRRALSIVPHHGPSRSDGCCGVNCSPMPARADISSPIAQAGSPRATTVAAPAASLPKACASSAFFLIQSRGSQSLMPLMRSAISEMNGSPSVPATRNTDMRFHKRASRGISTCSSWIDFPVANLRPSSNS